MKYTNDVIKFIQENEPKEIIFYEVYWGRGDALIKGTSELRFTTGIRLIEIIQADADKILKDLLKFQSFIEEEYDPEEWGDNLPTFGDWYSEVLGDSIEILFHKAVIEYKTIVTTDHSIVEYIGSKTPTFEELSKIQGNVEELRDDDLDHDDYGIIILGQNIDLPNMSMEIKLNL